LIGETIGHYRVLERLGSGGMGEVYLAEDVRLHRPVALKTLRDDVQADEDARARLLREARAAAALNHPGIAVIYEIDEVERAGAEGPVRFIAMEYVAGETLAEHTRARPPSLEQALDIADRLAEALTEAHARGIVHRDVKPSNVMVAPGGRLKILDFGLAKQHIFGAPDGATWSRDRARSGAGALLGTLAYMAPEQARGQPVDARADIYSLGVLLYELVAGEPPFTGTNAVQVLDAVLHRTPAPLPASVEDPRLPQVEALVRRMLSKEASLRPASMAEVRETIGALRRGTPVAEARELARAVAVLGFANISGHGEDGWLGTGMAETVMSDLGALPGLAVVAPARVREALRQTGAETGEIDESLAERIGRQLGARWVLSGGFQRAGDTVRVTARLADVESRGVLRTVKIDGRLDDIFSLQDQVVRELTTSLRMGTPAHPEGEETLVVEAYEAFSRGMINMQLESYESLDRAIQFFERAVALDPAYVRALVELGHAYATKADYLTLPEFNERALATFRRALERRPESARAWRLMGGTLLSLGRNEEGLEALRRALELAPGDPGALAGMGRALFVGEGRLREAASYFERALERDPQAGWFALQLAHCLALLHDFERGEEVARRAAELQESLLSGREGFVIVGSHMRLGHLAALQGRDAEAVEHFQRELAFLQRVDHALRGRITIELQLRLGAAHRRLGQAEAAQAALETARDAFEERLRLGADDPFTRYYAAGIYAQLGQIDDALASLERAASSRPALTAARAPDDPELEPLRTHPRFRALLQEVE
jgi:tetratricopeptide (TPR) repeat protein/TolB-like protein/predicted Ser/Thr protein kinase